MFKNIELLITMLCLLNIKYNDAFRMSPYIYEKIEFRISTLSFE